MKVCLLSDTHGYLDPGIWPHVESSDEVWHAGDFGPGVAPELKSRSRLLRGVHGNIDDEHIRDEYPEDLRFECNGVSIWMTHIGGYPGRFSPRVRKLLARDAPDLFLCGHSHIMRIDQDPRGFYCLNPGACGRQGFHLVKTLVLLEFQEQKISRLQVVELGGR